MPRSREFIQETVQRIEDLMDRNVRARTYHDLSQKDNWVSMDLVSRIEEIVEAMHSYQSENLSDEDRKHYEFVQFIQETHVHLFKQYFAWFRGLSARKPD